MTLYNEELAAIRRLVCNMDDSGWQFSPVLLYRLGLSSCITILSSLLKKVVFFVAVLLFSLSYSFSASALELGNMHVSSLLQQKLAATIAIEDADDSELAQLEVTLAAESIFKRLGVERTEQLKNLVFSVKKNDKEQSYIEVTSTHPIESEFLNFLIEVNWPGGHLLREFTALLDQPIFLDEEPEQVSAPEARHVLETQEPAINRDKKTSVIPMPGIENQNSRNKDFQVLYAPVKKNESLWKIADKTMPEGVTIEQMIYALYLENPEAFYRQNMNNLKEGSVLRLNSRASITAISPDDAQAVMARHHKIWMKEKQERQSKRAASTGAAIGLKNGNSDPSLARARFDLNNEARLALVTPEGEPFSESSTDNVANRNDLRSTLSNMRQEQALANETLEAAKKENEVLQNRLQSVVGQVNSLRNLIQLKDEQLRLLQDNSDGKITDEMLELALASSKEKLSRLNPPEKEKPLDSLWNDPLVFGTGFGIIVLLISLVMLLTRNRKKRQTSINQPEAINEIEDDTQIVERVFTDSDRSHISDVIVTPATAVNTETSEENTQNLLKDDEISAEPKSSEVFAGSIDPASEADVYIAYGKYDKAEAVVMEAILSNPDQQQLKLKLLEVYAASANKESFIASAEELYAALAGDTAHELWKKAQFLAQNICSDHPLFSDAENHFDVAEHIAVANNEVIENKTTENEITTSIDDISTPEFDIPENKVPPIDKPSNIIPAVTNTIVEEQADTPLSTSEISPASTTINASPTMPDKTMTEEERAIKEDMLSLAESFSEAEQKNNSSQHDGIADVFSDLGYQHSQDSDDASMFLLADEIGTKLDLARAYIEMGDKAGAKELLSEVEIEGDTLQKTEAKKLMALTN